MADFKVGDTVMLKSGGPVMTVFKVPDATRELSDYGCTWFSSTKRKKEDHFPGETLERAERPKGTKEVVWG